MIIIMIIALYL